MIKPFELQDSNWSNVFDEAVRSNYSKLKIVCPFIKKSVIKRILRTGSLSDIRIITRFSLRDFIAGVSDIDALQLLLENGAEVRGIRNLHAKLYLFGDEFTILTSANLTEAALNRNHEFGFVANDLKVSSECHAYFDNLWNKTTDILTYERLNGWDAEIERYKSAGGNAIQLISLADEGTEIGLGPLADHPDLFALGENEAYVKFFGEGHNRADTSMLVIDKIKGDGSHWACTYPKGKRPRQVQNGDHIYIAALVKPDDIIVYGRALAMGYRGEIDDASDKDKQIRIWKTKWPHYIRVYNAQFIGGILENGISLKRMMVRLEADSFTSTQKNVAKKSGNNNPRKALRQKPEMHLTSQAHAWLKQEFDDAIVKYGNIPPSELAKLDGPL